jgi:preprotein translocase subunit SecE
MAKSATVVRDDKQGTQPVKVASKVSSKAANHGTAGSSIAVAGNQVTGIFSRAVGFLKETRSEMTKVSVPSKGEVRTTTTVVIVTVFAFAAYFYIVDAVLGHTVQALLRWLGGTQ